MTDPMKTTFSYPVGTFCGACGQPVHQDTPAGWDPRTAARMVCRNQGCADFGKPFLFEPTKTYHTWATT